MPVAIVLILSLVAQGARASDGGSVADRPVAAASPVAADSPGAPDRALFNAALGTTKIGDQLPDFSLKVDGRFRKLSDFKGRPLVLCLVFNAIPAQAYVPRMEAITARYRTAYGVQSVVVKVNTPESDYHAWLDEGPASYSRGWDPAGRFVPAGPETASMEQPIWEMTTLLRTLLGPKHGGAPAMPAYIVVSADGKFGGWLTGHPWFGDGLANLLMHAGVPLVPEDRPRFLAHADDFLPETPLAPVAQIAIGQPMPRIDFIDLEGQRVELSRLRGRVVLIDFWATWCGPCKEEIPNLKKVYAAYHDRGFEVVGVALENAGLRPGDTPAQTAVKLEKAKKVLLDFTRSNAMPWPQYFDGKHWKNDLSTRFGIGSIPAMILVDREGNVASTNARGEKLEAEVKRLLGL